MPFNDPLDDRELQPTTRISGCVPAAVEALEQFRQVLGWGGVISGEHGIGLAKKRWWPDAAGKEVRALHRSIKDALDPKGILNPGKFL